MSANPADAGTCNAVRTFAGWFYFNGGLGSKQSILGVFDSLAAASSAYQIVKSAGDKLQSSIWGGTTVCDSGVTVTTGVWYHVAITTDGSNNSAIYVNGVQKATSTQALQTGNVNGLMLSNYRNNGSGTEPFNGLCAWLGHWRAVLTDQQIASLAAGWDLLKFPSSLWAYWKFQGDVNDYSGNSRNWSANGTSTSTTNPPTSETLPPQSQFVRQAVQRAASW
jgi:hypothetical protein